MLFNWGCNFLGESLWLSKPKQLFYNFCHVTAVPTTCMCINQWRLSCFFYRMSSNNSSSADCLDTLRQPKFINVIGFSVSLCVISLLGNCLVIALIVLFKKDRCFTQSGLPTSSN